MMGKQDAPEELFYRFRLEDYVPLDHPLRALDAVLDFHRVRTVLADHYSRTGRPSIDPELILRMLLVGYAFGIRSERQLCGEVHLNLAYRKVEMLFGHMKRHFRFTRLKLRGLAGGAEEFLLVATVQNLRRLVRMRPPNIPMPCRAATA